MQRIRSPFFLYTFKHAAALLLNKKACPADTGHAFEQIEVRDAISTAHGAVIPCSFKKLLLGSRCIIHDIIDAGLHKAVVLTAFPIDHHIGIEHVRGRGVAQCQTGRGVLRFWYGTYPHVRTADGIEHAHLTAAVIDIDLPTTSVDIEIRT